MVNYKLKNGRIVQILDDRDLFDLIREELGDEIANRIEDDYDINGEYQQAIEEDYEKELSIKDDKIEELEDTIESLQEEIDELKGEE